LLPKQIGNLNLLKTLDVDGTLPASIVQLTKLVRLCAGQSNAPHGIGNLTSLEELRIHGNHKRFVEELGSLQELRVLIISTCWMNESMKRDFVVSLRNLKKIQHIYVDSRLSDADTSMWEASGFVLPRPLCFLELFIHFSKLPSCINPSRLPNLSHLRLGVTTMDEQDLKLLARLPALCFLDLETESTVTASNINVSDGCCFQKLRYFEINKMVLFEQPNEEDTRISLHIWNGEDTMPFGSWKSNHSSKPVPCSVMPNLEVLHFDVPLRALKHNNGDCGNTGLEYLPSLRELRGAINCYAVSAEEVDAALGALRNACKVHPNHPTLSMLKSNEV